MAKKKARKKQTLQSVNRIRHRMEGVTSTNSGHQHLFSNISDQVILAPGTHFHTFHGITTTENGVRHVYNGMTGPSINGTGLHRGGPNHFHNFQFTTNVAGGHRHTVSGTTTKNRIIRNSTPNSP
ncbi:YmaF family protein [Paenibacillus sp. N1-5-1-14]|uniref:YmaF family protein n=1 Tax=Paenibacillus radicibacter TaxID=2972488 RepID=UPI0021593453|nr:YmaF family protein [Paenibacillus radicibacter]MCR8644299.1 YmaF family protein [Paenibacillus radicibacter]